MAIKNKYYGNLQLDNLGKAVKTIPGKVEKTEKYGHQIKVKAAMWEDGGITIEFTSEPAAPTQTAAEVEDPDEDLPF